LNTHRGSASPAPIVSSSPPTAIKWGVGLSRGYAGLSGETSTLIRVLCPDWKTAIVTGTAPAAAFRVAFEGPSSPDRRAALTAATGRHNNEVQGQTWRGGMRCFSERGVDWIEFAGLNGTTGAYLRHYVCKILLPATGGPADGPDDTLSWAVGGARVDEQLVAAGALLGGDAG
jgi:hypothetical protein